MKEMYARDKRAQRKNGVKNGATFAIRSLLAVLKECCCNYVLSSLYSESEIDVSKTQKLVVIP